MRFYLPEDKKLKIVWFWGGNFPDPEVPDPTRATKKLTALGQLLPQTGTLLPAIPDGFNVVEQNLLYKASLVVQEPVAPEMKWKPIIEVIFVDKVLKTTWNGNIVQCTLGIEKCFKVWCSSWKADSAVKWKAISVKIITNLIGNTTVATLLTNTSCYTVKKVHLDAEKCIP